MRFIKIDWTSDDTWIWLAIFVVILILTAAMERASPKRKKRKLSRMVSEREGEIID